jgi:hypothetical protein
MKKIFLIVMIQALAIPVLGLSMRDVLIDKGFRDDNTFFIICKGYPDLTLKNETQRAESAKEAALINAEMIARELFDDSVDVVRNGLIEDYTTRGDYTVITYVVQQEQLIERQK